MYTEEDKVYRPTTTVKIIREKYGIGLTEANSRSLARFTQHYYENLKNQGYILKDVDFIDFEPALRRRITTGAFDLWKTWKVEQ